MMLSSRLGLAGVGLFCLGYAATLALGCSSSSSSGGSNNSSGGTDSCSNTANACIVPPAAPTGGATTVTASHNYAVKQLFLGDTDRNGVTSSSAWESFGYNLDNLVTTSSSKDVCTLYAGSSNSVQVDGNGGIDNSFGLNIMPIVLTAAGSQASQTINTDIQDGKFTIMAYVTGFDDTAGSTASATGLTGLLLAGGDYTALDAGAPAWSTSTKWPIVPTLLNGCTSTGGCPGCSYGDTSCGTNPLTAAQITFPSAYQAKGTFVNGSPASLSITLSIGGQALTIDVHSATITFDPNGPGSVTNGTIAGALVATELVTSLRSVAGHISTSLCSGSAFDSIATEIDQASDIIVDPSSGAVSNAAGTPCNGISIGLGFNATEIAAPTAADIEAVQPPAANPCGDAGTD
jgi:hypothetical protein